jgi:hypothetical protein
MNSHLDLRDWRLMNSQFHMSLTECTEGPFSQAKLKEHCNHNPVHSVDAAITGTHKHECSMLW